MKAYNKCHKIDLLAFIIFFMPKQQIQEENVMDIFVEQQAYRSEGLYDDYYRTETIDADGYLTSLEVRWDIIDPNAEEEEYACDWDDFNVVDRCGGRDVTDKVRVFEPVDYHHVAKPGEPGKWKDMRTGEILKENEAPTEEQSQPADENSTPVAQKHRTDRER